MDTSEQREPPINQLFRLAGKHAAAELVLEVGSSPRLRLKGILRVMQMPPLNQETLERLVLPLLYDQQAKELEEGKRVVFTYACEESDPFRVEVFSKEGQVHLAARRLGANE
jgi:twitching motility protein PilT